jgi:hypothetical protein
MAPVRHVVDVIEQATRTLWNWNEQADARAKRLFIPHSERIAVARFQKPSELSIRCRPEHEIESDFAANFRSFRRDRPFRSNADHEFDGVGQSEELFE